MKTSGTGLTAKAKVIIAAAAAAVVTAGIVAGVLLTRQDTYRVLKVFELMGTASVTRESAGDLDAYVGMNLESGDVVSVDDGSNMRISLDSDKYVLLDSGTVLELVATGSEKDSRTSLNLREGAILNEITSALSENSSYEVNAPKATMAVRGTSYSVTVTKDGDRYIIELDTFHGRVGVRLISEDGTPGEEVMVGEGKSVLIITEPNENTHNSPDIDGHSYFVIRDPEAEGGYRKVDISEAVFDSEYDFLAASIKERVIKSNSSGLFQIKDAIIEKLTGGAPDSADGTTVASSYKPMSGGTGTSASVTQASAKPVQTSAPAQSSVTSTATAPNVPVNSDNYTSAPVFTESTNGGGTSSGNDNAPRITGEAESTFISGTRASGTETENSAFVSGSGVTAPENSDTSGTRRSETSGRETYPRTTGQGTSTSPYVTNPNVTNKPSDSGFSPLVTTRPTGTGTQTSFTTRPAVTTKPTTSTTASSSAEPEPEVYTVTFTDENGLVLYTRQVEEGDTVSSFPQVPAKTGYTGVWLVKGSNVQFTAATAVTSDMTVYASYSAKEYTITLVYSDSKTQITAKYGDTLSDILPVVPEKAGHDGIWTVDGKAVTTQRVTGNMTVTAKYTPRTYTVTMNVEGTTTTINAKYGDVLADILPVVPEKAGHDGIWTVDGKAVTTQKVTGNMTVSAKYTPKTYTVTIIIGSESDTKTAEYGTLLADILPELPEKNGYNAVWTVDGEPVVIGAMVTGDITVTAEYTQKEFTVSYTDKNGTGAETYADSGEKLLDVLADPEVGNELDLKYTWLTRNNAWDPSGHSGMVKVNDSHTVTKDIDSKYEVKAAAKNEITYYIGDDINGYTAAGSFWLMTNDINETISNVQPGYLATILPAGYTGFAYTTDYGSSTFDEYDTAYGVNAIYTYNYILTFVNNNYDYTTKFFPTGKTVGDLGSLPALSDPANNVWAYYKDGWQELTADTQVTEDMDISEVSKSEVIFHTVSYTRADGTSGSIQVGEGKNLYEALTTGGLTPAEGYSWVDADENTVTSETLCTGDMTITEKGNLVTLEFYYNGTMYSTENVRVGDKVSLTADMLIGSTGAPFSSLEAFRNDAHTWKFTVDGVEYSIGDEFTVTGNATVTVTME